MAFSDELFFAPASQLLQSGEIRRHANARNARPRNPMRPTAACPGAKKFVDSKAFPSPQGAVLRCRVRAWRARVSVYGNRFPLFAANWPALWVNCTGLPAAVVPAGQDCDGIADRSANRRPCVRGGNSTRGSQGAGAGVRRLQEASAPALKDSRCAFRIANLPAVVSLLA